MKITGSRTGQDWNMEYEVDGEWLDFDGLVERIIDSMSEGDVPDYEIGYYGERRAIAAVERYLYLTEILSVG
jgi:hypothetical protein